MAREGDGGAPTLTGCQEVSSPFRSQRGLVGRMGVKRPEKGSKWRLWREHATYLQTAQLLFQYAVMAKVAAHASQEKNRPKTISYNNLRRKLSALYFCQNRKT